MARTSRNTRVFRKSDLIETVQKKTKLSRKDTRAAVEETLNAIATGLKKSEKVQITGFGAWTKKKIPARKGGKLVKNPFTGEMVKQKARPAQTKVKFRPGPTMKKI